MGINNYKKPLNYGFTLVELSIVLVLISLLVAAVMSGQKLVQHSKLQNLIKEIREFDSGISGFKDKFHYYPGDFPEADIYWPLASPDAVNGNKNWQIETGEDLQFWKQLALAGFISGSYTGTTSGTHVIGTNAPKSIIQGGGYQVLYASSYYNTTGNTLMFGSMINNTAGNIDGKILSPQDAYTIDIKIDDGLAAGGNLYTAQGNGVSTCVSAAYNDTTATYILSDTTISCRMFWWLNKNK